MSLYFMKYSLGRPAGQKTFLYIIWMLWAFLRQRSYSSLLTLGGHVIAPHVSAGPSLPGALHPSSASRSQASPTI
jgi:hypothetical protein